MLKFMGVDQSYTSTGVVIIDNERKIDTFCVISTPKEDNVFLRAWNISCKIKQIIHKHQPVAIGIEGLAFSRFGNATRDLAGLQFTIVTTLRYNLDLDVAPHVFVIPPLKVKKIATGKGNASKKEMVDSLPQDVVQLLRDTYKKTNGLYDLTDAYWIARFTLQEYENPEENKSTLLKPTPEAKNYL